ncbi:AAA family ATPase [Viridibacillus sp. YIM B01967]|uniref:Nuclease SbcCD subunit C n=1 Tax=Viridibacillus soli TaxID=2798301 RepID=A0ABS1H7B4_9BACL|nr:AAA family ATPase [Viridibacillus soli]MBK3495194.1 AAA family ATPase [Viridibacillus soli]
MKPIQLKMTAFGPYKKTETIDFRELGEHRLFVISGATGAGKTTIFDGISFALYGSASGEDRADIKEIRSDFADEDTHTSAELIFEIHNRQYRVLRQLAHRKKGNKTATGESFELVEILPTGEKPVVESQKVGEINKKIEDIIGLSKDQFKQIVMLPQGEFRKLLTSETENKEAILRKIFKTESYRHIADQLKVKKDEADKQLQQAKAVRDLHTSKIASTLPNRESNLFLLLQTNQFNMYQLIDALQEEIIFYEKQIAKDETNYKAVGKQHEDKQREHYEAITLNQKIESFKEKEQKFLALKQQEPLFLEKERELAAAEKASHIIPIEQYYREAKQTILQKEVIFEEAKNAEQKMKLQLEEVNVQFTAEQQKETERNDSLKKVMQLQSFEPVFKELEEQSQLKDRLQHEVNQLQAVFTEQSQLYELRLQSLQAVEEQSATLETTIHPLDEKIEQLAQLKDRAHVYHSWSTQQQKVIDLKVKVNKQEKEFKDAEQKAKAEQDKWVANQASILAAQLVEGAPCPVCGSTEHSTIHEGTAEVIDERQLEQVRKYASNLEQQFFVTNGQLQAEMETFKGLEESLQELSVTIEQGPLLTERYKALFANVQQLKKEKELWNELKEKTKAQKQAVSEFQIQLQQLEKKYQHQLNALNNAAAIYEEKQKSIPQNITSLNHLYQLINEAIQLKTQLAENWTLAQQCMQQASEQNTTAQANLNHATTALLESNKLLEKAQEEFKQAVEKAGFEKGKDYIAARRNESECQQLKDDCMQYKNTVYTLAIQIEEEKEYVAGKEVIDLAILLASVNQLKHAYEVAFEQWNNSKKHHQTIVQLINDLSDISKNIVNLEASCGRIIGLYDLLRGQNSMKISFERYVQIEYLEQIIHAANERLKPLSNGQFNLIRSDRQEARGKQSGLGLDVYDAYTGQTRDVKTLSGGEKFNASLCLALGMSDVIQSFQGNIRIDTMFIDEGFGTLDEESLTKAIDTLIDLQKSGRMIGVISHVAELKAAMPAILEVKKSKEGHSHTTFHIK